MNTHNSQNPEVTNTLPDWALHDYVNELEAQFRFEAPKWMGIDETNAYTESLNNLIEVDEPAGTWLQL